jgi:predicted AAA+ superfamily ATPase
MVNVKEKAIVENVKLYTEFKGSLAEQFVAQEISSNNIPIYYWSSEDNRQEIDFLIENDDGIIPIEVKAGQNLSSTSFNNFIANNKSPYGIKLSVLPYVKNDKILNLPLYLANVIK